MTKFLIRIAGGFLFVWTFACGIISCSRLDMAVNWADTYIASQVDDYFDISFEQNKELKESLKKDIQKIRTNEFPQWAKTFRELAGEIRGNTLSEEDFNKYFETTLQASRTIQPVFSETAVKFIASASPEQLTHFERTFSKKNVEYKEKIQNSEKTRNESRKKYIRGIEMGIDSLSKDQDQLLNRHLSENPFPAQALIKNRNHILEKFIEAKKSPESLKTFVRAYYQDKYQFADPEYQQALKKYQTELSKFVFQLFKSLDEKQKSFLCESLAEKAGLLDKMATKL